MFIDMHRYPAKNVPARYNTQIIDNCPVYS